MCSKLDAHHSFQNGIVHGSLKPSNVLIQGDGTACIADADLVKIQPSSSPDSHRYYSPEAWKGVRITLDFRLPAIDGSKEYQQTL